MNPPAEPPVASPGSVVLTACRGYVHIDHNTPHTVFRGRRIYFCLKSCLKAFQDDPQTSCLAGDPLLEQTG